MEMVNVYNKGLLEGLDIKPEVILRVMKCLELCIAGEDVPEDEDFEVLGEGDVTGKGKPADKAGCLPDEIDVCQRIMRAYNDVRNDLIRPVVSRFFQTGMNTRGSPAAQKKQAALKAANELLSIGSREVLCRSWENPAGVAQAKQEFYRLAGVGYNVITSQDRSNID